MNVIWKSRTQVALFSIIHSYMSAVKYNLNAILPKSQKHNTFATVASIYPSQTDMEDTLKNKTNITIFSIEILAPY